MDRARGDMGARQIAEAHQEFTDDLPAREGEALAEELDPFLLGQGVVLVQPSGE